MKTKEELKALKEEVETLSRKLAELNEEELAEVSGAFTPIAAGRSFSSSFLSGNHGDSSH